ncbi:MAG: CPBP family intramembrane metalloprotease [Bacteroidales bacterium]|nr:CPBP family intramembrane metalloprotease [Bacteroidales bacterium]
MPAFFKKRPGSSFDLFGTHSYWAPDWTGLFWILVFMLIGMILGSLVTIVAIAFLGNSPETTATVMPLSYVMMFVPVLIYVSAKSASHLPDAEMLPLDRNDGFAPLGAAKCALLAAVSTLALSFVLDPVIASLPEMPDRWKKAMEIMTEGPLWSVILSTCILAPIFEEWLCRGLVLRGLLRKTSPALAIIVSALFFALIHGNIWQGFAAFSIGCLLGYVYWKTRSLKLTVLMHFVNNAASVVQSRIPAFDGADTMKDVIPSVPMYWAIFAACAAALLLCLLDMRKLGRN